MNRDIKKQIPSFLWVRIGLKPQFHYPRRDVVHVRNAKTYVSIGFLLLSWEILLHFWKKIVILKGLKYGPKRINFVL